MNKQLIKLLLIRYASVIVIFVFFYAILSLANTGLDKKYISLIPMILAIILAPRLKWIKTQNGKEYYLTILFTEKTIK